MNPFFLLIHSRKSKVEKFDKEDEDELAFAAFIFCKQSQVASQEGLAEGEGQELKLVFRSPPCNKNHRSWILKPIIENKGRTFKKSCTLLAYRSTRLLCHLKDTKKKYIYNLSLTSRGSYKCKKSKCVEFGLLIKIDSQCSLHVEVFVLCETIKKHEWFKLLS